MVAAVAEVEGAVVVVVCLVAEEEEGAVVEVAVCLVAEEEEGAVVAGRWMKQCKCTTLRSLKLKATCTITPQSSLHSAKEAVGRVRIEIPSALGLGYVKTFC